MVLVTLLTVPKRNASTQPMDEAIEAYELDFISTKECKFKELAQPHTVSANMYSYVAFTWFTCKHSYLKFIRFKFLQFEVGIIYLCKPFKVIHITFPELYQSVNS